MIPDYNAYYKMAASQYNEIRLDKSQDFETTLSVILENCDASYSTALDIGCGTGQYGKALMDHGFSVIGIDKSASMVSVAQTVISSMVCDASNLPFGDDRFDLCTMIMMVHQLNEINRLATFDEVHRVLKNNGSFIIKTCSSDDLRKRLTDIFFPECLQLDMERYPKIATLYSELKTFFSVAIKPVKVEINIDIEEFLCNLSRRRSSNLAALSDEQLICGIHRIRSHFGNQKFLRLSKHNTFVICKKEK